MGVKCRPGRFQPEEKKKPVQVVKHDMCEGETAAEVDRYSRRHTDRLSEGLDGDTE